MNTVFCPHCGYENASQNNFCVRCGTQLTQVNTAFAAPIPPQEEIAPPAQTTKGSVPINQPAEYIAETISITSEVAVLPQPEPVSNMPLAEVFAMQDPIPFPPEAVNYDEENITVPQPTVAYSVPFTEENTITTPDVHRFVLENSDMYATAFEKLENGSIFSLNWAALLFGPYWFLYRKQYLLGGAMLVLQTALQFIFGRGFFIAAAVFRVFGLFFATPIYASYVKKHIVYAKMLDEKPKQDYFKEKGSTSLAAVALGILVVVLAFTAGLFYMLWF